MDTCIVFIVLETLFILMLLGSRFLNRNKLGNGFPMLMAASYLICVMKITLAICRCRSQLSNNEALTYASLKYW